MATASSFPRILSVEQRRDVTLLTTRNASVKVLVAKSPSDGEFDVRPCLSSIRAVMEPDFDNNEYLAVSAATQQAHRLQEKLGALDKIGLSEISFSRTFRGCRLMILSSSAPLELAWSVGLERLLEYSLHTQTVFYSQPDYDQMAALPEVKRTLGTPLRKSRHWPSALGTLVIFSEVLVGEGRSLDSVRAGIVGVGNLGKRIADGLLDRGIRELALCDRRIEALLPFTGRSDVVIAPFEDLPDMNLDALILAADTGTLSSELAQNLATHNGRLLAVGGPEAGLDTAYAAIKILIDAGIIFLPSFLCGAMGLCANLEEALGIVTSNKAKLDAITVVVRETLKVALESRLPFHIALKEVLNRRTDFAGLTPRHV